MAASQKSQADDAARQRKWGFLSSFSASSYSLLGCIGVWCTCSMFYLGHRPRKCFASTSVFSSHTDRLKPPPRWFPRGFVPFPFNGVQPAVRQHLRRVTHHYQGEWSRYDRNNSALRGDLRQSAPFLLLFVTRMHHSIYDKAWNAMLLNRDAVKPMICD